MPKLWKVITLSAIDRERKEWLVFKDDQKEEEAISLHLRNLRSPEYQELEVNLCQSFMGVRLQSIGVYSAKNFWKPLNHGHRVTLFC